MLLLLICWLKDMVDIFFMSVILSISIASLIVFNMLNKRSNFKSPIMIDNQQFEKNTKSNSSNEQINIEKKLNIKSADIKSEKTISPTIESNNIVKSTKPKRTNSRKTKKVSITSIK